jgi:hypothetical protein
MDDQWEIEGMPGAGGNCGECGDNLCAECAGKWSEDGLCGYCAMSLEELEYALPITVSRKERKDMPCPDCERNRKENVLYEQRIYRHDDYLGGKKKRMYEISYVRQYARGVLFNTSRRHSLREAFIETHKTLDRMGLNEKEGR